eukprot:scaffold6939_cov42-Prasinocladus_malaysianus.AAC.2
MSLLVPPMPQMSLPSILSGSVNAPTHCVLTGDSSTCSGCTRAQRICSKNTRNAEDVTQIFKNQEVFRKSPLVEVMGDWLGDGLATQRDIAKHANVRRLLNPAFRQDYIRGLSPVFSEVGEHLAESMLQLGEHDIQDLAMRATLDIIGLTGFRYGFGCLDLATGKRSEPVTIDANGKQLDVAKLFDQLVSGMGNQIAFASVSPRQEWIPGFKEYKDAIADLDKESSGL